MPEKGPDLNSTDKSLHYTYAEYLGWENPGQYQIFFGRAAPVYPILTAHQALLRELLAQLGDYIEERMVLPGTLSVRLFPNGIDSDDTIVKPDFFVPAGAFDMNIDAKDGLFTGVPDMIVEMVSPPKLYRELFLKYLTYRKAGVREYWVIDPHEKKLRVTVFENTSKSGLFTHDALVPVDILPGCKIDLESLWAALE